MKKKVFFFLLLCLLSYAPIVRSQNTTKSKNRKEQSAKTPIIKYGIASYYAKKFSGRKTSTGARYNAKILTAACNVLPLGTWVRVTNLRNKRSGVVEINDRMHPKNKRLIDLSKAAAQKLGYIARGITRVKVEVLILGKKRKAKTHRKITR